MSNRVCVICGTPLTGKRQSTCSDACRAKLSRQRKKMQEQIDTIGAETVDELDQLAKAIPAAAAALWKIKAIAGDDMFKVAFEAVRHTAVYFHSESAQAAAKLA